MARLETRVSEQGDQMARLEGLVRGLAGGKADRGSDGI